MELNGVGYKEWVCEHMSLFTYVFHIGGQRRLRQACTLPSGLTRCFAASTHKLCQFSLNIFHCHKVQQWVGSQVLETLLPPPPPPPLGNLDEGPNKRADR